MMRTTTSTIMLFRSMCIHDRFYERANPQSCSTGLLFQGKPRCHLRMWTHQHLFCLAIAVCSISGHPPAFQTTASRPPARTIDDVATVSLQSFSIVGICAFGWVAGPQLGRPGVALRLGARSAQRWGRVSAGFAGGRAACQLLRQAEDDVWCAWCFHPICAHPHHREACEATRLSLLSAGVPWLGLVAEPCLALGQPGKFQHDWLHLWAYLICLKPRCCLGAARPWRQRTVMCRIRLNTPQHERLAPRSSGEWKG